MMCLIDNQQIPVPGNSLLMAVRMLFEKLQRAQHLLLGVKRVFLPGALGDSLATLFVKYAKRQIEAP